MKIIATVSIVEESLYSIKYKGNTRDEFTKLFELWNDIAYLENFFEANKYLLEGKYWKVSVEDAIFSTLKQANALEQKLINIAESGKTDRYETLSTLFKPLHDSTIKIESFEKNKAKSGFSENWLRIYAIRIAPNFFVITGGAIKLTRTMNEVDYLLEELKKLEVVQSFLKNDENIDDFSIFELF